jgi:hypothetical protein
MSYLFLLHHLTLWACVCVRVYCICICVCVMCVLQARYDFIVHKWEWFWWEKCISTRDRRAEQTPNNHDVIILGKTVIVELYSPNPIARLILSLSLSLFRGCWDWRLETGEEVIASVRSSFFLAVVAVEDHFPLSFLSSARSCIQSSHASIYPFRQIHSRVATERRLMS